MKGCLKFTPPLTPQPGSSAGSPFASGSASPASGCTPLTSSCRKTVSFCRDLEEFFEADDWDRSPAPVAPKLCYQDILELKQIMQSLPRAPQPPSYRQHFTTSLPQPSPSTTLPPSTHAPFPVSRFASMPSATPSKWKNRDASREVDREILPYLDSVPIQLLPLLPPSSEPPQSGPFEPMSTPHPNTQLSTLPAHIETPKPPISSPVPMVTPPPSAASSASHSPAPSSPILSPVSSPPPTPRRTPNFSFVPLLPVKEEVKLPPPPPVVAPPPVRRFNMTFVPLLPPEDPAPPVIPPKPSTESVELTPQNEVPPEAEPEEHLSQAEDSDLESVHSPPSNYLPLSMLSRSYTSTPSLSSASDTDTETESEAPSVSSAGPSSPREQDDDDGTMLSHYFVSHATFGSGRGSGTHNPYFPALGGEPFVSESKVRLHALPSPALQPPSPFSLYPGEGGEQEGEGRPARGSMRGKREFVKRPSALSALEGMGSDMMSPELTIEAMRNVPASRLVEAAEEEGDMLLRPSLTRRE
ncbi:hypothetical protein BDW22DRAFT_1356490 [Trametopsis cervina]|nr:hypothetical protein BDW22DRAFT_1356490 [Trametopsis cervina]